MANNPKISRVQFGNATRSVALLLSLALTGVTPAPASEPPADTPPVEEIRTLLRGHTGRGDEARILQILRALEKGALNAVLTELDLSTLVGAIDDRRPGPDHRSTLLRLVTQERVAELGPAVRARLILALQRGRTSDLDEKAIFDLMAATRGHDLTALKNAVDQADHRGLLGLVYRDIDDTERRKALLAHLDGAAPPRGPRLKVLSDIDDTFYANWTDKRYPKRTIYPGVRAFYRALDRGATATPDAEGDLVFLTARPRDPAGMVARQTRSMLRQRGVAVAAVLLGDVRHLLGNERMAEKKVANFERYQRLFPEYRFVFIGDSGQGDAQVGRDMRSRDGERVPAVFIHDVVQTESADRAVQRKLGVHFFDTYPGAALRAYQLGLIGDQGLSDVAQSAVDELSAIRFDDDKQREARRVELARDLEKVNAALPPEARVELPAP